MSTRTWSPPGAGIPLTLNLPVSVPLAVACTGSLRSSKCPSPWPTAEFRTTRSRHCVLRAAPGDPDMGAGAWQAITAELMHRTGLSEYGQEDEGVRGVAVHHGDNHVHIVAVLARMDGRPVRLHGDWYRIAEAMAWAEKTYGLTPVARGGPRGTAERRATRAETEKAAREYKEAGRTSRPVPTRTMLRRLVEQAAAAARTETEFFHGLATRGVAVRLRYSMVQTTEVTGYAVGLRSDATGVDNGPVWFGGGKLAPNLTLPRLRARSPIGTSRLTGRAMTGPTAHVVLAREVLRAARASRTEDQFFAELDRAGLLVRPRSDPSGTDRMVGYAVTLPGLADRAGQPVWFGGGTLATALRLGEMRARWRAGRTGAPPGVDMFAGADAGQIYAHAVAVAQLAAAEMATARSGRADIAYAAADLLVAAAQATGNPELHRAADGLNRADRAPWSRPPRCEPTRSYASHCGLPTCGLCPRSPADCGTPLSDHRARRPGSRGRPIARRPAA